MNTPPSVAEMMGAYAQDAVDYAQRTFGISLDYSEGSVQQVERVLTTLSETVPKGTLGRLFSKGPSPQEVDQISKMFGGYVREVLRREWGGRWKLESAAFPGQQVLTLEIAGGGDVWPHFKVGKRLTKGPEENLWMYVKVLKEKYQKR